MAYRYILPQPSTRDQGLFIREQEKKRSFIVVVGDRAKDVIVHLHYIMSSVDIKQNKSVLWAYKKDLLGFTRLVEAISVKGGPMLIGHVPVAIEKSGRIRSKRR